MEKSLHDIAGTAAYRDAVIERLDIIITLLEYLAGVQVGVEGGTDEEDDED